jgi:hypothetical protein
MFLVGALAVLLVFFSSSAVPAERRVPVAIIECPPVWPGPDAPGAPRTFSVDWRNWRYMTGANVYDTALKGSGPGEVQLDCAYGRGGQMSRRRITMILPGHPQKCWGTKPREFFCEVGLEDDGTLGPVVWRMAEPITKAVALKGLRLGMTREEVLAGGGVEADATDMVINLSRDGIKLQVHLDGQTGLVREVIQFSGVDNASIHQLDRDSIFRFGFNWNLEVLKFFPPAGAISKNVWSAADNSMKVEYHPATLRDEPASLHVIDGK